MSQSLSRIIVHLIFSTKDRFPSLEPSIRPSLHPYLATILRDMGCLTFRVGGVADHVHIAFALSRTLAISTVVEKLKTTSTKMLKLQHPIVGNFAWQRGYGAFSVGNSGLEKLLDYIDQQEEHHRTRTFQEEYRDFLKKYAIEYDERYIWD